MIDMATLIPTLLKRLRALPVGDYLDVCSYKRDRYLHLIKVDHDSFRIVETGFEQSDFVVDGAGLKKSLKVLVKREFPRSNKIRLYSMGQYEPGKAQTRRQRI